MSVKEGEVACPNCDRAISRPASAFEIKNHIATFHKGMSRVDKASLLIAAQPPELFLPASEIAFDDMDANALGKFWAKYHRPHRKDAEMLVGARPHYVRVAQALANYAINLASAKTCRLQGNIHGAQIYEGAADRIYDDLPEDLKW